MPLLCFLNLHGDANTAKAQPQEPPKPPPSAPGGPEEEELQRANSTHAYAANVANDGYPRYISAEYVPRGYVAILQNSEKTQEGTDKEQANSVCSDKEQANCSKIFGEPPSEESDSGQEQAN